MLGISSGDTAVTESVTIEVEEKPTTDAAKVKSARTKTKPVTVKVKNSDTPVTTKKENKASLAKMTKVQIEELAREKFGVELDRRKTKDNMIQEFMTAQKKAK